MREAIMGIAINLMPWALFVLVAVVAAGEAFYGAYLYAAERYTGAAIVYAAAIYCAMVAGSILAALLTRSP